MTAQHGTTKKSLAGDVQKFPLHWGMTVRQKAG